MNATYAVIVGAGGHAVSVAETVRSAGFRTVAFVSENGAGGTLLGSPILPAVPENHVDDGGIIVVAIGDNTVRQRVWNRLSAKASLKVFPALCHASASIAEGASLSPGVVILQGAVIGNGASLGLVHQVLGFAGLVVSHA